MKNKTSQALDSRPSMPGALRIARLCWVLAAVLFFGFAASLFLSAAQAPEPIGGPWFLGALLTGGGVLVLWLAVRLWRSQPGARTQLTWLGLIAALPLFLRFGRYSILAAMVLVAVGLMWTPASIRYFRALSPRTARRR